MADSKGKLPIRIDLISAVALSQVQLSPLNRHKNKTHLYDRDKQAWMIESDASLEYLKFRIYFTDTRNVPRNHMRYVWWGAYVVPARGHYKPMPCVGVPFANYYFQMDVDAEGFDMNTDISVKEISNPASAILDKDGHMTIQIEWVDAHLLYNERFNRLDEVNGRHKVQMSREILALQAENLSLEKQIYSYQVSISRTNSKNGKEDPVGDYPSPVVPPPVIISEEALTGATSQVPIPRARTERKSSERRRSRSRDRRKSKESVPAASADTYYDVNIDRYSDSQYLSADPYASDYVSSAERHVDGADATTLSHGSDKLYASDYVPSSGYQDKLPQSPKDKYGSDPYMYQDTYSKQDSYSTKSLPYTPTTEDYPSDRYDKRYQSEAQYYSNGKYSNKYPDESLSKYANKYPDEKSRKYSGKYPDDTSIKYANEYSDKPSKSRSSRDKYHDTGYKDDRYIDSQYDTYNDRYDKYREETYDKYQGDPNQYPSSYNETAYPYTKDKYPVDPRLAVDSYSSQPSSRKSSMDYTVGSKIRTKDQISDDGYYSSQTDHGTVKSQYYTDKLTKDDRYVDHKYPSPKDDRYGDHKYPSPKDDRHGDHKYPSPKDDRHGDHKYPSPQPSRSKPGRKSPLYQEVYPEDGYNAAGGFTRSHSARSARSRSKDPMRGDKYYEK